MGNRGEAVMNLQEMPGRRDFLTRAAGAGVLLALGSCNSEPEPKPLSFPSARSHSPAEAMLQDHGLLSRVLLVYEESMRRLAEGKDFKPLALVQAAHVMNDYIVDCHQSLEEIYLFPRFRRSDTQVGLIEVLCQQHAMGRRLAATVLDLGGLKVRDDASTRRKFADVLGKVVRMYRPHEAREDSVLFPLLRNVVPMAEYDALGEDIERERSRRLGQDGFERFVGEISESERAIGISESTDFDTE